MKHVVLVVDRDVQASERLKKMLGEAYNVELAQSPQHALVLLQSKRYDLMLAELTTLEQQVEPLLDYALRQTRCRHVVLACTAATMRTALAALHSGISDILLTPCSEAELRQVIERCLGGIAEVGSLQAWRQRCAPELIGEDPKFLSLLSMLRRIADTDCDVLITGDSGTGKELAARCIHNASRRHKNPFVALNCAAIPKDLMESEIFGHSRGAFTGATERRSGKFEVAAGGTLFLDETGEMDLTMQSKFLRVIQEREVTPIGDSRTFKVDVRIISATNQNLDNLRRDKLFREDLYYRLNVVPVHLPALAERRSDIVLLVQHFIERANRRYARRVRGLAASTSDALLNYSWPGNVREMQHLIERLVILSNSDEPIAVDDLPTHITAQAPQGSFIELKLPEAGLDINETLTVVETRLTLDALQRAKGNKARAAELLGLKRTTLVERLKKLHLETSYRADNLFAS